MTLKIGANQPSSINLISDKLRQKTDESAINSARQNQNAIENLNRRIAVKKPESNETEKTIGDFLGHVLTKQPLEEKSKEKKVYLDVKYPKPPEQMTVKDYQTALIRAEYKQAGLGMLTDDEIKMSEDALAGKGLSVKYYGFDLTSLQNDQRSRKPLFTTDYMLERAQRGGQAVLQYREYQSLNDDAKAEYARRYAPDAVGGFVQPIVNAPVNIANGLSEPFRAGERALFGTSYIPEIPRMQVAERSEYWNQDGRMLINKGAEIGATITFGGMAGSKMLATQPGRFMLGTESAYNLGAGIGGKDITQTDENGNVRQMPLLERGLRVTGGLFGARSVVNAEIAAPNSAVNKLDDIFKNNTLKPQTEAITPNGFRIKVPQTEETKGFNILEMRAKKTFSGVAPDEQVVNALKTEFKPIDYKFGNNTLKLSRTGMKHILQRHHPDFWNGSIKDKQSYFAAKTTIEELQNVITSVLKQNREILAAKGTKGQFQILGEVDGIQYKIGVKDGQIKQLYTPQK